MNKYQKLTAMLQEIIDAGQEAVAPLDMSDWFKEHPTALYGFACCLMVDVAVKRLNSISETFEECQLVDSAISISIDLDVACHEVFNTDDLASSIYDYDCRYHYAYISDLLTPEELTHPHLTTDHNDRTIAHDYIRLVMRKVAERERQDEN